MIMATGKVLPLREYCDWYKHTRQESRCQRQRGRPTSGLRVSFGAGGARWEQPAVRSARQRLHAGSNEI